jgi:plasmid stability protein
MAVLNLRNVPEELMRDLRKAAVDAGLGLHDYCRAVLARGVEMRPGEPSTVRGNHEALAQLGVFSIAVRENFPPPPETHPATPDRTLKVEIT